MGKTTMNTSNLPARVQLIDVGPRDGLQNEKQPVPAAIKIELVQRLQAAGLTEIEVTAFLTMSALPTKHAWNRTATSSAMLSDIFSFHKFQ
jgi:isopropylmalate/homocitrate/citramalate synthase